MTFLMLVLGVLKSIHTCCDVLEAGTGYAGVERVLGWEFGLCSYHFNLEGSYSIVLLGYW